MGIVLIFVDNIILGYSAGHQTWKCSPFQMSIMSIIGLHPLLQKLNKIYSFHRSRGSGKVSLRLREHGFKTTPNNFHILRFHPTGSARWHILILSQSNLIDNERLVACYTVKVVSIRFCDGSLTNLQQAGHCCELQKVSQGFRDHGFKTVV